MSKKRPGRFILNVCLRLNCSNRKFVKNLQNPVWWTLAIFRVPLATPKIKQPLVSGYYWSKSQVCLWYLCSVSSLLRTLPSWGPHSTNGLWGKQPSRHSGEPRWLVASFQHDSLQPIQSSKRGPKKILSKFWILKIGYFPILFLCVSFHI